MHIGHAFCMQIYKCIILQVFLSVTDVWHIGYDGAKLHFCRNPAHCGAKMRPLKCEFINPFDVNLQAKKINRGFYHEK